MGEGVENGGGGQDGRRVEVMNNKEDNIVARGKNGKGRVCGGGGGHCEQ